MLNPIKCHLRSWIVVMGREDVGAFMAGAMEFKLPMLPKRYSSSMGATLEEGS